MQRFSSAQSPNTAAQAVLLLAGLAAFLTLYGGVGRAQDGPSFQVREAVLKSLVYVRASNCSDNTDRAGSGFALDGPGTIITAHHVVGGCRNIRVTYEGLPAQTQRSWPATIQRVLSAGDLALVSVAAPPSVPALKLAPPPPDPNRTYAGFGYQNAQLTAGDQLVTFSTGARRLSDILPNEARKELERNNSAINFDRAVLRFNVALQPGMSGGPIIDANGRVIGIVAGGLKAGAAPASWGWPSEWISSLQTSTEQTSQNVTIASSYYTLSEMNAEAAAIQSDRNITCGVLTFSYRGTREFPDIARSSDDQQRLQYIMAVSTRPLSEIESLKFDIWVHKQSGATVVTPAGYPLTQQGDVCTVRSSSGPFSQVVWGTRATDPMQVQQVSQQFELGIMFPRAPYQYGFQLDFALTTQGPQLRENGMVFNRKGFTQPKAQWVPGMPPPPFAHTFETLIAKTGTFLGVGTINDDLPPALQLCIQTRGQAPGCASVVQHVREWTHFILATQLSTYPST